MSWNVVLDKFKEIKQKAIRQGIDIWAYNPQEQTCLDYWISLVGDPELCALFHMLELNEFEDFLLIRYGNYSDLSSGEIEVTMDTMWDIYDGFLRECRSVVIDIRNDCLVLTPFRKFRNLNEGEENSYEAIQKRIESASCVEISDKLDGSMQSARYYQGTIVMAGSQALDRRNSWRLADGYRMLIAQSGYVTMLKDHPNKTFIFEYLSQKDAHVVKYDVEGLFLIGIRDVETGAESSYREVLLMAEQYGIPSTKIFDKTLDEILCTLDDKSSCEAEGFVVNIDGFKVKIKYNDYVHMHRMLGKISSVNVIIENIAEDHFDDLIAKIPFAYRDRVMKVANIVFAYKREMERSVEEYYDLGPDTEERKTFMLWVNANVPSRFQGYVRNRFLGKPYHVLRRGSGYLKLKDMGITNYKEVFQNE